jgi:hypothetical protein
MIMIVPLPAKVKTQKQHGAAIEADDIDRPASAPKAGEHSGPIQ